jgi:hypothetical protein
MKTRGTVFYLLLIACGGISSGQSYAFGSDVDASGFGASTCDVFLSRGPTSAHFLAPAPLSQGTADVNPKPPLPEPPGTCGTSSHSVVECTTITGPVFAKGSTACGRSDRCLSVGLQGSDAQDLRIYLGIGNDGKYLLTVRCGGVVLVDSAEQVVAVITGL